MANCLSLTGRIKTLSGNETTAKILGYAGLIPFLVFAAGSWVVLPYVNDSITILLNYAAIILSFMGAIHWGVAMAGDEIDSAKYYVASVIPALLAWIALLLPQTMALSLLLSGFIGLLIYDSKVEKVQHLPSWYIPMRIRLTITVSLCLAASLISVTLN